MFSFKVEYTIRILVEMEKQKRAGIGELPNTWLRMVCGNDARGLSIVIRHLQKIGWLEYNRISYLYSSSVDITNISLYDLFLQVDENVQMLPKPLHSDKISQKLREVFERVKVSEIIDHALKKEECVANLLIEKRI